MAGRKSILILSIVAVIVLAAAVGTLFFVGNSPIGISSLGPPTVTVSGHLSSSGQGTKIVGVTFADKSGNKFDANVSNNQYSIPLKNPGEYDVQIRWAGSYSWQTGNVIDQFNVSQGFGASSTVTKDWNVSTPNSQITVSGQVSTSGEGSRATGISFNGKGGIFPASLTNNQFSVTLPNLDNYAVSVQWSGTYSWQTGTVNAGGLNVNLQKGLTLSDNIQATTPASHVTVSGTISTTGSGTSASKINFNGKAGLFSASVTGGQYSISLPNLDIYSTSIQWSGGYSWQTGSLNGPSYNLDLPSGAASGENLVFGTPNSNIVVTGTVHTNGIDTHPDALIFTASNGQVLTVQASNVNGHDGSFTITLPNLIDYSVQVQWTGFLGIGGTCTASNSWSLDVGAGTASVSVGTFAC